MAIVNRTLAATEQRVSIDFSSMNAPITIGQTGVFGLVPYACTLDAVQIAAFGSTQTPNLLLSVNRFITGQGATSWNLGTTFAVTSYGSSGVPVNGISLPVAGSTLRQLVPGDVVGFLMGGGASALIQGMAGCLVIRPIQDVRANLFQFLV